MLFFRQAGANGVSAPSAVLPATLATAFSQGSALKMVKRRWCQSVRGAAQRWSPATLSHVQVISYRDQS